jgi:serine phosphatase RsbU (regulator of sigma subunit)
MIAGTDAGIYEINGKSAEKRSNDNTFSQWYSPGLGLLFTGGSKGVRVFRPGTSFSEAILPVEIKSDVIAVAGKENKAHDSCTVWIGTRYEGVIRIVSDKNRRFKIDRYNESDGLTSGPVMPFFYNDNVILGSSDGFYRFVDEKSVKLSLPDSLKNNPDFLKGYFTGFKSLTDTLGKSISSFLDTPDRTWICADNNLAYVDKSNGSNLVLRPFLAIDAGKVTSIYPENDSITWFCTSEGLARYNNNDRKNYDSPYEALIRKAVTIKNDSVLFEGRYYIPGTSGPQVTRYQPDFLKQVLPFRSNSLRFEFSATFFENSDKMLFSSYLEGNDAAWTGWEHKYYQDYTNLREGSYTFHVKAKNVFGKISSEASYSFTILPPWYRSLPALLVYVVASFFLVWLIVRLYSLRLKRENIRLEGIVMERTAEVVMQRDILEHQKKEIEDSIRYAGRIQNAVLPASSDFQKLAPDSFVFFRPRDIVSGDFYWIGRVGDKTIISVADCTGHGVPGAFMSMLGVAFLNEIVNKDKIHDPKTILDTLRDKVIEALQQQGISGEAKDGMDIVVICIDETEMKLQYSGAYNPLIMVKKGQLSEIQADKMPIAIYERMKGFTRHDVSIEKGDIFYFFSDGFEDQFGGPEGKKFKARRFKELLAGISGLPMDEQKEIIEKSFTEWKGDLNQVDDIVVVGVRI